ncbi:hypothetical protein PVL29_019463 [Vitis rotundifolia]|uniref:K-box domain-containing protein n=1 Tax=Vitis rotundifolia TaxID=103349 RepID=A0AA38Z0L2_VITRO|nr:hypothetical protein PVL29_019463 [Vitis rotundifolia]
MLSSTGKLHEYISPSTTMKQIFDQYQNTLGVDLWSYHYERMQENLKKLKDVNKNLRKEIRQRMGEHLSDLSVEELLDLEQEMESSLKTVRDRKYQVRNVEQIHRNLLLRTEMEKPIIACKKALVCLDAAAGSALRLFFNLVSREDISSGPGADRGIISVCQISV